MKSLVITSIAALALLAAGCDKKPAGQPATTATPAATPAAGQDWTATVVETPEGGYRMGNPDAAVKLIEYASLTCPHCRDFTAGAADKLRANYVTTGKVSWEFRNFVLNPLDASATLLARCQGAGPFFKLTEQLYADQDGWVQKFNAAVQDPAASQRIQALPEAQQFSALAKAAGLDQFFRARGLPEARIDACLADKAGLDRIVKLRQLGTDTDKITGTPSFIINGKLQEGVYDWIGLEAKLREALG